MDAMTETLSLESSPAVVIDKVSMTYSVTSDAGAPDQNGRNLSLVRRLLPGLNSGSRVEALKEISLIARKGEVIGVIGLNGSGKSTLMKLICGKVRPTTGNVYASSTPTMLGVSAALVPGLSGAHNIMLGCLAMGMTRGEIAKKYEEILDLAGLGEAIHFPMSSYSAGMSSRLRFAIAVSVEPEILIMDEALNTGDDEFKDRTKRRMDQVRERAGCVFLVSHSLSTIADLCTRVIWLDKGDLLFDGEPQAALNWYRRYTKHLAERDRASALRVRRRLQRTLNVVDIHPRVAGRRRSAEG